MSSYDLTAKIFWKMMFFEWVEARETEHEIKRGA